MDYNNIEPASACSLETKMKVIENELRNDIGYTGKVLQEQINSNTTHIDKCISLLAHTISQVDDLEDELRIWRIIGTLEMILLGVISVYLTI